MRKTRTARTTRRTWAVRCLTLAGAAGLVLAGVTPSVAAAAGTTHSGNTAKTWVVKPLEPGSDSPPPIQEAVNKAKSGDTIKIEKGTYPEAVCIVGKGLTIKGAGWDLTKIVRPPTFIDTDCWDTEVPFEGGPEGESALKFLNPDGAVTVTDLQTKGHPESGIVVWKAKRFTVKHTKGVGHGVYGILATAGSTNILISDNVEQGPAPTDPELHGRGTAGISVGDTPNAKALIKNNRSQGEHLGIFVREARGGIISNNTVRGNCVGILVFDDSFIEKPERDPHTSYEGGDWAVLANRSTANNSLCHAGLDGSLLVSGVGMAVVNADTVLVSGNTITDNHPDPSVDPVLLTAFLPPAGLQVRTVPKMPPDSPIDPGPAEKVKVIGNIFKNNQPLDIQLFSQGSGNVFKLNLCKTSDPASICSKWY